MPRKIAALTKDLMFSSRIRAAADGEEVALARSLEELREIVGALSPSVVILDLADKDAREALESVKSALPQTVCVGYYPHVDKEVADKFRKLGCDKVMPRSRFVREIASIIGGRTEKDGEA